MVKIQKRQLTRNELVALNFIILGISLLIQVTSVMEKKTCSGYVLVFGYSSG